MDWGGVDAGAATGEPAARATRGRRSAPAFTPSASVGATMAAGKGALAHGLAGALDPAGRSVVTESVVRAGGGIVWRHGEGGGVEIVLVQRLGYDDWSFPRASSTRARPRPRRPCARSKRRPGYAAAWA
jgi:hypothetical protein